MRTTERPCYVCQSRGNPIVASEAVEHRFGRPLMPEGRYDFARCRTCSTLYVDSAVSDEYLKSFYERETVEDVGRVGDSAAVHDLIVSARLPEFRKHWRWIRSIRPPRPSDALLDLGCQSGEFGMIAKADGVRPHGVELSESYATLCRRKWGPDSIVTAQADFASAFAGVRLSYVTAFETLEHTCDPLRLLQAAKQVLDRDGLLAVSVPASDYFHLKYYALRGSRISVLARSAIRILLGRSVPEQVLPHTHIYNFSAVSLRRLMARAGFEVVLTRLTGWHGRFAPVTDAFGQLLARCSGYRVNLSPSVFVLARPMQAPDEPGAGRSSGLPEAVGGRR